MPLVGRNAAGGPILAEQAPGQMKTELTPARDSLARKPGTVTPGAV
jgi:hypothetical protein